MAVFSVLMVESRFLSVNLAKKSETCESREAEKDIQPISTCVLCSSCVFVEALIFNCTVSTVLQLSKYCCENMHFQYFGTICANVVLQLYNTLSSCSVSPCLKAKKMVASSSFVATAFVEELTNAVVRASTSHITGSLFWQFSFNFKTNKDILKHLGHIVSAC